MSAADRDLWHPPPWPRASGALWPPDEQRHARQAGDYSGAILIALIEMRAGDYAAAQATLEQAERRIRVDDGRNEIRVEGHTTPNRKECENGGQ